uniref:protein-tyrosine-phosphatase n=1 Tax=Thermorudis sp. TaxID=1969470 RepID=A0A7C2WKH5_9BACT
MQRADGVTSVLFVCRGNTCRSPMAAALARKVLGSEIEIQSAGIEACDGAPAAQNAVAVMAERPPGPQRTSPIARSKRRT